ncbi:ornithine carbamoyltransferase [Clostridia bacterium]|nr:ornithine carbamoyltransferase [Clostridia bacterium]
MKNRHLLKLLDLDTSEIMEILNYADQLKYEQKHAIKHEILKGKTLGMIFKKSSTRTRLSFEAGMYQLGGHALFLEDKALQTGRGESVIDTVRVFSRYLDGIMIRTFEQKEVEDFAQYGSIPVINGLTDASHPCQVLADLMTIREYKNKFDGIKLCYIGDGNNMANSLIVGGLKVGMSVSVACPAGYYPGAAALEFAKEHGGRFTFTENPLEAAADADVLYTDVWTSMGGESDSETRKKVFAGKYQINAKIMEAAHGDAIVQHCLPAHKGEEITEDVFESHAGEIFDEAENRLHVQKSVMVKLMS